MKKEKQIIENIEIMFDELLKENVEEIAEVFRKMKWKWCSYKKNKPYIPLNYNIAKTFKDLKNNLIYEIKNSKKDSLSISFGTGRIKLEFEIKNDYMVLELLLVTGGSRETDLKEEMNGTCPGCRFSRKIASPKELLRIHGYAYECIYKHRVRQYCDMHDTCQFWRNK